MKAGLDALVGAEFGSERNSWARQCLTYWDMAAGMVLHGAIQEDLFFAVNGEPFFLMAGAGMDGLAVLKAHIYFIRDLPKDYRKRKALQQFLPGFKATQIYPRSMVMDFFLLGRKNVREHRF